MRQERKEKDERTNKKSVRMLYGKLKRIKCVCVFVYEREHVKKEKGEREVLLTQTHRHAF